MRKRNVIVFILVSIFLLTACSSEESEQAASKQELKKNEKGWPVNEEEVVAELEETEILKICTEENYLTSGVLSPVIEKFKEEYSGVEIEMHLLPYAGDSQLNSVREAAIEKIRTETMAGKGPDLFILSTGRNYLSGDSANLFEDIEKNMRSGLFCDLIPLIIQDNTLDLNDYYSNVVNGCQIDGKQYIFPLSIQVSMMLTTEENLKQLDFDTEKSGASMDEFITEAERCFSEEQLGWISTAYYNKLSYPLLNYDTGNVQIGENEKRYFEWSKKLDELSSTYCDEESYWIKGGLQKQADEMLSGDIPMSSGIFSNIGGPIGIGEVLSDLGKEPVFLSIPNEKGGVTTNIGSYAAVRANSENKKNAIQLLTILLSEEMQKNGNYPEESYPPIRKGEALLDSFVKRGSNWVSASGTLTPSVLSSLEQLMGSISDVSLQQIWYVPVSNEITFNDMVGDYMAGLISYEEFVERVSEGLTFYWGE